MKNFRREGKVGEWAIAYVEPPYPVLFAEIREVNERNYTLNTGDWFTSCWEKSFCSTFETKEEAEKEYYDFRNNRSNYAYEG